MTVDYRDTVFLPSTPFPMRGRLPDREPELLERWRDLKVYRALRERRAGEEKFVLHDGPPYANGHLHIGHALNKILKDIIVRSRSMLGMDSLYVPGWDCHGLPIEWKMEEQYRAAGKDKDDVPVVEFRRQCREFADKWIDIQRDEFKRLGVEGDWDDPYVTMSYAAEAQIAREIAKFAMNGGLYRGARPVLWSVVEKTALADAEVEYHDHVSHTIWVRFPVTAASVPALEGASVVIWTTTPWTMPGNRAIAYGAGFDYVVLEVTAVGEGSLAVVGEKLAVAKDLLDQVCRDARIEGHAVLATVKGAELAGTAAHHPLKGQGYDFEVRLFPGDFVTVDQGTGFVHIAPGHGADDYEIGRANKLEIPFTVQEDGSFHESVPLFAGKLVYTPDGGHGDANPAVKEAIQSAGGLLAFGKLKHSYPHSWRSKAPLIFRNTPQWFISMEENDLRAKALRAIGDTRWVPGSGETRIRSMIESRPDWCVSRQRVWGVPLPLFVNRKTGELLRDQAVFDRVAEVFEQESGDAWFDGPPARFLGNDYDPAEWEQVKDVVEVWFDSGSTHSFVLEQRPDQQWPASLYLEGSDQHRGWFHTSLLESCGTRGRAPYEAVLTHGFTLDEDGRKMSKSLGNVVSPGEIVKQYGADILRLWVVTTEYSEDQRIGPEILKQVADIYRRFRNTLRFLLGNLHGFTEAERVSAADMPELERWVLHRLSRLDDIVRKGTEDFDFHAVYRALHDFCAVDLSAFYFDVRKDALYCDRPDDPTRRAARTVLDESFKCLAAWLAPFLSFTAEEAWLARDARGEDFLKGKPGESVHFGTYPDPPADWRDDALAEKWRGLRDVRRVVTGALELERAGKRIGSSLRAHPTVYVTQPVADILATVDLAALCITSDISVTVDDAPAEAFRLDDVADVAVTVGLARGGKCERCWRVLPDVGSAAPGLCGRCADAVDHLRGQAA